MRGTKVASPTFVDPTMSPKVATHAKSAFQSRCLIIACLFLVPGLGGCSRADTVDDLVNAQLAQQKIPGAAVAVVKSGKVVKVAAYGLADVELGVPASPDTVFRIQSMTKQFTATGVAMLVENGKVRLDDPVGRYFDGCPPAWQTLTVRHLLTQTSGLKDFINEPVTDLRLEMNDQQLLESIAARPLNFEPGAAWEYSNSNYHLLAMIIRKASGQWYGDFLAERIFKPLGMTRTSVPRERDIVLGRAMGYALEKGRLRTGSFLATSISSNGGAGIVSTVLDLAQWDAALYTERLLKRATLTQMWTPVRLNNGTTHGYGFGWELGEIANHRRLSHGGTLAGFAGEIDRFVDDQLTVIVLTNLADSAPARIARAVAGVYIPEVAAPVYRPIPDREPDVTARFLSVLRRSADGGLRPEEFTSDVWAYVDAHMDQMRKDMARPGQIEKLTLVERSEQGSDKSYRYQARFKYTTFIFHFVLTKEDRISAMMPEQVNQ